MYVYLRREKGKKVHWGKRQLSQSFFRDWKKMCRNLLQAFLPASSSPSTYPLFLLLGNETAFFQAGCYHIHGMVNFRLPRKYLSWSKKLENLMNRNRRSHKRIVSQCEEAGGLQPTQFLLGNSFFAKGRTTGPPGFCWKDYGRVTSTQEIHL